MATIADPDLLSAVWKRYVRKRLRSARLRDFYLAQDPVQFAAYEWGLPTFVQGLSQDLRASTFAPDAAIIVRGAKSAGLSRPLAVMSPRDALVYRTIVLRAEADLKRDLREWTGATLVDADRLAKLSASQEADGDNAGEGSDWPAQVRASTHQNVGNEIPAGVGSASLATLMDAESYEDDWFRIWVRKQGIIAHICRSCPYIVESDIANFFASVDLEVVREHLHSHTSLEKEVVRLCISLVRRSLPHPGYADSPAMGIPQEGFDSSRAIAHSLLVSVDRFFDSEGSQHLYSRFMDDFVIGAESVDVGHRLIARLQHALEPLGLYPNTAKTRVVTTQSYLTDSMEDENAWLEQIEQRLSGLERGPLRVVTAPEELLQELCSRFEAHRSRPDKPRRWDRVLRRYYAVLRRAGCGSFTNAAIADLRELPDSVTQILEYVRSFPLTEPTVADLLGIAYEVSDIYGDIPLLIFETVGSAPNAMPKERTSAVADQIWRLVVAQIESPKYRAGSLADRMVAAAVPVIAKFGTDQLQGEAVDLLARRCEPKSNARIQAAVLAAAVNRPDTMLMAEAQPGLPWTDVMALRYLAALMRGEDKAVGVALNLLQPTVRLMPNRHQVQHRPLMLLPILRSVAPDKMPHRVKSSLRRLEANPDRLRDRQAEDLFRAAVQSAQHALG